jgi:hypothetical protein
MYAETEEKSEVIRIDFFFRFANKSENFINRDIKYGSVIQGEAEIVY